MNNVIGIISYLPDDKEKREIRKEKIISLVCKCNELFDLPIIIIAQNWKDFSIDCCQLCRHDKPLGIVGARNELRKVFLNSGYDYLIMLDDDCEIFGTADGVETYLKEIDEHPGMFGTFHGTLLKLFAISKEVFELLDFGDGRVEDGDYFEDILFVNTLEKKYKDKKFQFSRINLREKSNNFNDENSTWFHGQYVKREIGDRTRKILGNLDKDITNNNGSEINYYDSYL